MLSSPSHRPKRCATRGATPLRDESARSPSEAVELAHSRRMCDAQPMGSSAWPVQWLAYAVLNDHDCAQLHALACDEIATPRSRRSIEFCLAIAMSGDEDER